MDLRIRPASESDAAAVAALWTEAYVTLGVGGRADPYSAADLGETLREAEVYVWQEPRGVAGVVALRGPRSPGRTVAATGEAELSRLAVAAADRRRGIGRALAVLCGERARQEGCRAIALWSRPGQVEAHRLYKSLGYRRLPERDSVDGFGQARLVFRLGLDRAGTMRR
jgi:ribosomal protein S18 acetylase RimI-like enzyme